VPEQLSREHHAAVSSCSGDRTEALHATIHQYLAPFSQRTLGCNEEGYRFLCAMHSAIPLRDSRLCQHHEVLILALAVRVYFVPREATGEMIVRTKPRHNSAANLLDSNGVAPSSLQSARSKQPQSSSIKRRLSRMSQQRSQSRSRRSIICI
jgi:hypothetical protein